MFANTFQSGFISIFYSVGSNPLQLWDKQVSFESGAHGKAVLRQSRDIHHDAPVISILMRSEIFRRVT
jgi:hypothetical protein